METFTTFLALLSGVLVRLAIPILGTAVLIYFLRRLDERWQAETSLDPAAIQKLECWKIKNCSSSEQKICGARTSPLPCWQFHRQSSGHLLEDCLSCNVFIDAPIPALKIEPRRM